MTKIMFVCLGNICRSPMAEFLMRDLVEKLGRGDEFEIASAATSTWEIGNGVHRGTREVLLSQGIDPSKKRAVLLTKKDCREFDYIIGMEMENVKDILRIADNDDAHKVCRLLDFTDAPKDIDDPWYTGDFETTYREVSAGVRGLLEHIDAQK